MNHDSNSLTNLIQISLIVITGMVIVIGAFLRRWSVGRRLQNALGESTNDTTEDSPDASAILSYYTAGHTLMNAGRKTSGDMKYSIYLTGPATANMGESFVDESAIIYVLDLPFNTQAHLVGLSKAFKLDRLQFGSFLTASGMQKTMLEGDFPDSFDIYSDPEQGFRTQYVLDPDTMAFVADYCTHYFWEIHDSELYMAVTDSTGDADNFMDASRTFVASLQPALKPGQAGAPVVHHEVPYGEYDGPALACPICNKQMIMSDTHQTCPDGHGILLNGRNLQKLNDHKLTISADASKTAEHGILLCPNCQHQMEHVQFQGGMLQIDSCTNCVFRWLDALEVAKLSADGA